MWRENEQMNTDKPLASVGGPEVQKRLQRSEDDLKAGRFLEVKAGEIDRAVEWLHEGATITEPTPAISKQAEEMRRRLGTLDPQQVAIWREMTPARKVRLAFEGWAAGLNEIWTIEQQRHPGAPKQELAQYVIQHLRERDAHYFTMRPDGSQR